MTNYMIIIPLLIIACCAGFYQLFTISTINYTSSQTISNGIPNSNQYWYAPNPSMEAQLKSQTGSNNFSVEMVTGVIALIIACTVVAVAAGIKLFGSGLSETSVKIIYNSTVYYGLWGIFSALSYPMFLAFPLFFGVFGWFILTLIYSLGFFESTWSHA